MRKSAFVVLLTLLALMGFARAEVFTGVTSAASEIKICAEADGVIDAVCAEAGFMIEVGDVLMRYRTEKAFASQDGSVAAIHFTDGNRCNGTVLEIMPMEKYRIYCTTDKAYQSADSTLVHNGERVYIRCTKNGTHRGIGVITNIDGNEYGVLTVGGEFHVGETVYLYRDADFSAKQRVGIGTVVENDTEKYDADGTVVRMHVAEGEEIERGQLLYETLSDPQTDLIAGVSGIVSGVRVTNGEKVQKGQIVASIVPRENIRVEIRVSESALGGLGKGTRVEMCFNADPEERTVMGKVTEIFAVDDDGLYRIAIAPDATDGLKLGMTARVWTD